MPTPNKWRIAVPETNPKANKIGLVAHGISKPWANPWHKPKPDTKIILSFLDSYLSIAVIHPNKNTDKIEDQSKITKLPILAKPSFSEGDQIIEMSRMEKLISSHMKSSIQTSAHVQSFIEVDVTDLWDWREKVKDPFLKRENEKLTFTPLFISCLLYTSPSPRD